jgi:hypothetical protein
MMRAVASFGKVRAFSGQGRPIDGMTAMRAMRRGDSLPGPPIRCDQRAIRMRDNEGRKHDLDIAE